MKHIPYVDRVQIAKTVHLSILAQELQAKPTVCHDTEWFYKNSTQFGGLVDSSPRFDTKQSSESAVFYVLSL